MKLKSFLAVILLLIFAFTFVPTTEAKYYTHAKTHSYNRKGGTHVKSHYRKVAKGKHAHSNYKKRSKR